MSIISRILVCGKAFFGSKVTVREGNVYIDDSRVVIDVKQQKIDIIVEGNLDTLDVGAASSITVKGSVGTLSSKVGEVTCGDVQGDVTCGVGSVKCDSVQGSVSTEQGDVVCASVGGNVHASMGDVTCTTVGGNIHTSMGDVNIRRG